MARPDLHPALINLLLEAAEIVHESGFDPERHKDEAAESLQEYLVGLEGIEEKVSDVSVPLSFSEELYHLRMHIDMLRGKLKQMIENQENPVDS